MKREMSELAQLNKFTIFFFCLFLIAIPIVSAILRKDVYATLSEFSGGIIPSLLALLITDKVGIHNKKLDEINRKKDNDLLIKRIMWELESNGLKLGTFINAGNYEHNVFHIENIDTTVWEKTNYKVELDNAMLVVLQNLYTALDMLKYSCNKVETKELKEVSMFICNKIKGVQEELSLTLKNSDE